MRDFGAAFDAAWKRCKGDRFNLSPFGSLSAPSRDELLADKPNRLKQELARSANQCLSELQEKVLPIVPAKTAAR